MSIIDTLVTDRTLADVELWKTLKALGWGAMTADQQAQWSAGMKGAYGAPDLNRVIGAVNYLNGVFQAYGYSTGVVPQTADWAVGSSPTASEAQTYLGNVQAMQTALAGAQFSAELPGSMDLLTYAGANSIEQILVELEQLLTAIGAAFLRSGMDWAYSGSPGFYFAN